MAAVVCTGVLGFLVWRMMFAMPSASILDTWRAGSVEGGGVFRYPPRADGAYVSFVEWPPAVSARVGAFSCGEEHSSPSGAQTSERAIEGDLYCVRILREGAAGSTYATYSYATVLNERVVTVAFTVRLPQCMNYDNPLQSECHAVQAAFDPDALAAGIVRTVTW